MTTPLAMIIEDDADIANMIKIVLQKAQFETEVLRDGQQALERLTVRVPNLVVLDFHLPRVSGATVLAHLRSQAQFSQTRVILTTADKLLAEQLQPQVDWILIKPFEINQLSDLAGQLR